MQRDEKGRFVKGVTPAGAVPFSEGTAKAMQARSAEARKENRTIREALLAALQEEGAEGLTKMEVLVRKAMTNHVKGKLSFRDLRDLAEVLGETKINITIDQDPDERPEINIE